jgi:hypothetical protein
VWRRSRITPTPRLAFLLISKLYRQMYANTGLARQRALAAIGNALGG